MKKKMNIIEEKFKTILHRKIRGLRQTTKEQCDFVLFFCPIVSRAGTDISAALDRLNSLQVLEPVLLVVLHHTFDHEKIIPDSNAAVKSNTIFAVDCLFNEDEGLLQCQRNESAVDTIAQYLKSQKLTSYACFNDDDANRHQTTDPDESTPLIHSETSWQRVRRLRLLRFLAYFLIFFCMGLLIVIIFLLERDLRKH